MTWIGQYILDENDNPVPEPDSLQWAEWFQNNNRVIQQDKLPNGLFLSTVFLGLDHNYGFGPPMIFESMIFDKSGERPWADLYCQRYSTMEQAKVGHQALLERINQGEFDKESSHDDV